METFLSRKRRRVSPPVQRPPHLSRPDGDDGDDGDEDSTELKLAILSSLHPHISESILLDFLLSNEGSVALTTQALSNPPSSSLSPKKRATPGSLAYQSSISQFTSPASPSSNNPLPPLPPHPPSTKPPRPLTRKGRTLHLYTPASISAHTPCTIIHNFLPPALATTLLSELLLEAPSFARQTFKLFDNVVQSPHSACFYVPSVAEARAQQTEYLYNGSYLSDIRQLTPAMLAVSPLVETAVNAAVHERIATHYPGGTKLRYQSPKAWVPNAAFVNCYDGGAESVGYHSDQLTYLGPRAVIGSLSLGVAREFRVRRVVPRDASGDEGAGSTGDGAGGGGGSTEGGAGGGGGSSEEGAGSRAEEGAGGRAEDGDQKANNRKEKDKQKVADAAADAAGQISIHLPHNSLLVMHADMQEEWKHAIAPASAIDPHPVAGRKRINITYRHYRESFHPRFTPRCRCGVATVLRCVQRKRGKVGRYFWGCHVGNQPVLGKEGCGFFEWASFDDDGEPGWVTEGNSERGTGGVGEKEEEEGKGERERERKVQADG